MTTPQPQAQDGERERLIVVLEEAATVFGHSWIAEEIRAAIQTIRTQSAELAALRAQVERLKKDAERYQRIRLWNPRQFEKAWFDALPGYIDAALAPLGSRMLIELCDIAASAGEPPPPDHLAPSEARGVVTDEIRYVQDGDEPLVEYAKRVVADIDQHEKDDRRLVAQATLNHWRMLLRRGIETALRARESAPAVETPPNRA